MASRDQGAASPIPYSTMSHPLLLEKAVGTFLKGEKTVAKELLNEKSASTGANPDQLSP